MPSNGNYRLKFNIYNDLMVVILSKVPTCETVCKKKEKKRNTIL